MSFSVRSRTTLLSILFIAFLLPSLAFAQSVITGKVTDADGNPVAGASVSLKGTTTGTTTGADGAYSLSVANKANATLLFSSVGFADKEVKVGSQSSINIQLDKNEQSLNAVVVVGYGTQKKKDVTGSVVSVSKDRLQQLPNTNIAEALQGAVPGLSINTNGGGAEGNNVSMILRGRKSISASSDPLIIWDGIPYVGNLSDINPNDVESIDILKDASAAAIYGARAANGVILITSKQGKKGKISITYDGSYGTQTLVRKPRLLNGAEFYNFKTTRLNAPNTVSAQEQAMYDAGTYTDWYDLATQTGTRNQQSISLRGATDKVNFYFGGTFLDAKGIAVNDRYKRYSLRPSLDIKITPWLSVSTATQFSLQNRDGLPVEFDDSRNTGGGANFFNPLTSPYDSAGNITPYAYKDNTQARNPLSNELVKNEDNTYRIFTTNNLKLDLPFVPGLSYKLNTGIEYQNSIKKTYYGRNVAAGLEVGGDAINDNSIDRNFTVENILYYNRTFGKHSLNVTALYSSQSEDYSRDYLEGIGFPNDVLTNYQMYAATQLKPLIPTDASPINYKINSISQMGRINYGYNSRYLITLTARRDGFSAFGNGKKYAVFPSVAVGWNVRDEKFMDNVDFLSNLKLRVSYGSNGNQAINSYASLAKLGNAPYLTGTTVDPGYVPISLANADLGWETTTTFNVGIDFGILKNRISGTIDVYDARTSDLLLKRQISSVAGITTVLQNIGKTGNRGIEVGINSTNISHHDLVWTSALNFSYNKNRIIDLYGNGVDDKGNNWFIGQPIRVAYDLVYDGIFHSADEVAHSAQAGTAQAGWVRIKDVDGSGDISTDKDRTIIGQLDPKWIFGLSNTVRYKNFGLMFFFQGTQGSIKSDPLQSDNVFADTRRNTTLKDWWSPQNPNGTHFSNDANANKLGVPFYEDGSYIRLKDVSLSYDIPVSLLQKAKISNAKVYISGRNLATFTKYKGLDPEFTNQYGLPLQMELVGGVTITL